MKNRVNLSLPHCLTDYRQLSCCLPKLRFTEINKSIRFSFLQYFTNDQSPVMKTPLMLADAQLVTKKAMAVSFKYSPQYAYSPLN